MWPQRLLIGVLLASIAITSAGCRGIRLKRPGEGPGRSPFSQQDVQQFDVVSSPNSIFVCQR